MAVTINTTKRTFKFDDTVLSDPDVNMAPEKVLSFYATTYPQLTNGYIKETIPGDGEVTYEIGFTVGDKG